jgi:carbonic anhydrase/acetyltransferase-like protein (isoleucine patch superfamily)
MGCVPLYALGDREPTIDPTAYVHPDAVLIGSVTIGPESSVWPSAVLRGDHGDIRIGARTSIQDGTVIHTTPPYPTTVGDDCVIGHLVHLEGCTIENFALVGSGAVVLHRAIVRTGSIVGAGAVVPDGMEVPTGAQALGVPARMRPDSVKPEMITRGRDAYVFDAAWYAKDLRRLD